MSSTYSPYKIFRFPEKIDSLSRENKEVRPPVHVRIKPINACNHDCYYCAYRVSDLQLGEQMDLKSIIPEDKMLEIIQDLHEMEVKSVTFSGGGEPLLYPYFAKTLRELAKFGIQFGMNTNGATLTGDVADIIAEHGTWIRISIDGWDAQSYAKYRNIGLDQFDKVINNINSLRQKSKNIKIGINVVVDKDNTPHLFELASLLKSNGADSIKFSPCVISNHTATNLESHSSYLNMAQEIIVKCEQVLSDEKFEVFNSYHKNEATISDKDYNWCPFIQVVPVIGADLMIYSCQDKAYTEKGKVGSIEKVSFKEFWNSDKNKFFKINPSKDCPHHCVADKKNRMLLQHLSEKSTEYHFV